ncbi:hypothetical protein ACLF6K_15935 [Streptomyces xanthophaeus]|uniref:hypothetical protein n=1 Tax=Streptomyces xanthophaeus TaxID=67385 RepID=UPI00398FA4BC
MKEFLTSASTRNTVGMLRNYDPNITLLILEGDSDLVTLSTCLDRARCRVIVAASGKTDAIQAVEFADIEGFEGVLAIVDSDFVDIHEPRSASANVFYTDLYDLDSSVFFADGIVDRCVEALVGYVRIHGQDVHGGSAELAVSRGDAVRMASTVGFIRLYSMQGSHELPLDNFPVERVFNGQGHQVNVDELKEILPKKCQGQTLTEGKIDEWLTRMEAEVIPAQRISQGHDLFRSLSYVVKKKWGVALKGDVWEKLARSHWRLDHMASQQLHSKVLNWSQETGYGVWADVNWGGCGR